VVGSSFQVPGSCDRLPTTHDELGEYVARRVLGQQTDLMLAEAFRLT
jgi:hypothetical protein